MCWLNEELEVNTQKQSTRAWSLAAAILTLGTAVCAILAAVTLDVFSDRPEGGGSITTLLPGVAYASATVWKVCLAGGLIVVIALLIVRVLARFRPSETSSNQELSTTVSKMSTGVIPTLAIVSLALTPLAPLVSALVVIIAQTLVDKPEGISLSYFPSIARTGVLVMMAQIALAALVAMSSLIRREGVVLLSILGMVTSLLLIALFWHFEFYALGFDQDSWAPR